MCKVLKISRSSYYYTTCYKHENQLELEVNIITIFNKSRKNYGTRRIREELKKLGYVISRKRIGKLMKKHGLTSRYTKAKYKCHSSKSNESSEKNILNRQFKQETRLHVIVSDLTYVRVQGKWHYICLFVDLYNREIVGFSVGRNKDAALVYKALSSINADLRKVALFHTDRGKEFDNALIDQCLEAFEITRSLSKKACPHDNAVAEATFKTIKTEFVKDSKFDNLEELSFELFDYINWFNLFRLHSSLDYQSPIEYAKALSAAN